MKNYLFILCIVTVIVLITVSNSTAQIDLKEYAKQRSLQWQSQRILAESVAVLKHMPIRVDREDGSSIELQRFENGLPLYYATDNLNAAKTLSTNKVWPSGGNGFSLTGEGVILGEWDSGKPRPTHQEYSGRILSTQGTLSSHSAHVAGTMIATGVNSNAKGMSYKASLQCFDWNNDDAEMASQAALGLRVSNHSYGTITGWYTDYATGYFGDGRWVWFGDTAVSETEDYNFGFYDGEAQSWDNIAYSAPNYLIVKAAGNDRNESIPYLGQQHWVLVNGSWALSTKARGADGRIGGYDCISHSALAKNILTVGAVNAIPGGYTNPSNIVMSDFSCWGPTDDGRVKPDIVADGVGLYSSVQTADNAYGTMSGTSMASPNTAGSVGLLLQEQNNLHGSTPLLSSTLKAIIINTADEAGPNPGPDYMNGWGLMNTLKAVQLMRQDSIDGTNSHIREMLLHQGDTISIDIGCNGIDTLMTTICWTDPQGTPTAPALNPTNRMLVNDLDLRIIKKITKQNYYPWILNPSSPSLAATTGDNIRDNIEQVRVTSTQRTVYTAQITHKGILSGGSQNVSLAISGNITGPSSIWGTQKFDNDVDSGAVKLDSFKVYNVGTEYLNFSINDSGETLPAWLAVNHDTGSIAPLDSLTIVLSLGDITQPIGEYFSNLIIENNDKRSGTINIPVTLHTGTRWILPANVNDKWNMVSLPVRPKTNIKTSLFPSSTGNAFAYNGSYIEKDTLSIGTGYWMKFNGDQTIPIDGYIFKQDTLDLHEGWNLIGSLSNIIPTNSITCDPTDIISSLYFGYNNSYFFTDSIYPGKGYWIQLNKDGKLFLSGVYPTLPKPSIDKLISKFNTIEITDAKNNSQILYLGSNDLGGITSSFFTLPPKPPSGGFDARFSSGKMLEFISDRANEKCEYVIHILGATNPIKINLNMKTEVAQKFFVRDEAGKTYPLSNNNSVVLYGNSADERILTLKYEALQTPKDFALQQNYPNPFNPSTMIKYEMPTAGHVRIKVYNILGNEVATLVDGVKDAGYYTIDFDAHDFASGIYLYKMETDKFISYKKMILMR